MISISNDTLLSIALFALYMCLAWELFDHFSGKVVYDKDNTEKTRLLHNDNRK